MAAHDVAAEDAFPQDASPSHPAWQRSLAVLERVLEELSPAGGRADVVLSNSFVRYGVVPWTENAYARRDRQALAAGHFRTVYGAAADAWRIVVDAPHFGQDALAAAVDGALPEALRDALARHRLRLASLHPHLVAALARSQRRLEADCGAFILVEPDMVSGLFRRGAGWAQVVNRRYRRGAIAQAEQAVVQCIETDRMQGGGGPVALVAPGVPLSLDANAPCRVLKEEPGPWRNDPCCAMAWSAARGFRARPAWISRPEPASLRAAAGCRWPPA